jgi:predicted phage terminase large subunit-like protein
MPSVLDLFTPDQAAAEVLRRRQLRTSLEFWCRANSYVPAKHHRLLISKLEAVARGEIDRLAIFMPPGSAKSTYASILFPSWLYAVDPTAMILAASHTTELAERWGRRVRNLVAENAATLNIKLTTDNQAAGRWGLEQGGEYYAAGALTGIAGFRARYGLIDDPIRSRQDADSSLLRDRLWDWYLNDFRPRLVPRARQVLIQTRWHEDDLAGRALNHEPWEVLSLPAEAKANDPLARQEHEFLWDDDDYGYGAQLESLKATTPPRIWSSLYQQEPTPEEGDYFKDEWLHPVEHLPDLETLRTYGGSDYAVTKDGGDYTVHAVVGVDPDDRMYLLDIWRGQITSDIWIDAFCHLVKKYKPLAWAEEQGQIRAGVGPFLDRRQRELQAWTTREKFPTRGDKAVRARSIQGRMSLDGLYVPKHAPWLADFRAELLHFPAGVHDDQVDALGLIGQLLDKMIRGRLPKPKTITLPKHDYKAIDRVVPADPMLL